MISVLVTVVLLGLLIAIFLAPVEVLGWWAGWYGEGLEEPKEDDTVPYAEVGGRGRASHFVVFLDGIAKVGAGNYKDVQALLDGLSERLPDAVMLGDVMPYSPRNLALTEGRPLAPFWRYMFRLKLEGKRPLLAFSINLRNFLQVLVAADRRYGPIYGQGEAQAIANSLLRLGYRPGSGVPITLIGYSGGAQIALLAAPFLKRALGAPVSFVSLGGVMASERGLMELSSFYLLRGTRDRVTQVANLIFPGRWPLFPHSYWNRYRRAGTMRKVSMGPMQHHRGGSYLDPNSLIDGQTHLERTTQVLTEVLGEIEAEVESGLVRPPASAREVQEVDITVQ